MSFPWTSAFALIIFSNAPWVRGLVYKDNTCPILSLLPFTKLSGPTERIYRRPPGVADTANDVLSQWDPHVLGRLSFDYMAAAQLAIDQFNIRDPSVVPELAELGACPVMISKQVVRDSMASDKVAVREVWESSNEFRKLSDEKEEFPCAILGPAEVKAAIRFAPLAGAFDVPYVLFHTENMLAFRQQVRTSVGIMLAIAARASRTVEYLMRPGFERDYLAVVYGDAPQATSEASLLKESGVVHGLKVEVFGDSDFALPSFDENRKLYKQVKRSGIKTVLIRNLYANELPEIAEHLEFFDMLTDDYLYILSPAVLPVDQIFDIVSYQTPGSSLDKLLSGAIIIDRLDGFRYSDDDPFLQAWRKQNVTFVDRLNAMVPISPETGRPAFQAPSDYFQNSNPLHYSSYVYDAVMLMGIGGCNSIPVGSTGSQDENRPPPGQGPPPGGSPAGRQLQSPGPPSGSQPDKLSLGMFRSSFSGASGHVEFAPQRKERIDKYISVGAYNIVPTAVDTETGLRTYQAVLTSIWEDSTDWRNVDGATFIYRNGLTVPPALIRSISDPNYISNWVRGVGLFLLALSWLLAFGCMGLLVYLRTHPVVSRSQPVFLHLLCVGSIILSTAIFTLSWDEGAGWSQSQLDSACAATPWFFFLGHVITVSAMFTNLWPHRTVSLTTLVILVLLTCTILIVWTVLDPWSWTRELIQEVPSESYGECESDHFWAFFASLMSLVLFSEAVTAFLVWRTSSVSSNVRDSGAILLALCVQLEAWVLGLPILVVLGNSSADATYFARTLLIWTFAVSSVGIVVVPKIVRGFCEEVAPPSIDGNRFKFSARGSYHVATRPKMECHPASQATQPGEIPGSTSQSARAENEIQPEPKDPAVVEEMDGKPESQTSKSLEGYSIAADSFQSSITESEIKSTAPAVLLVNEERNEVPECSSFLQAESATADMTVHTSMEVSANHAEAQVIIDPKGLDVE